MSTARGPHERQQAAFRRANLAATIEVLRDRDTVTVTELARSTGLSRPTVESIIGELTEYGLVTEAESGDSDARGAGRPARLYAFRADANLVASVDIGLHTTTAMIADLAGRVLATVRRQVDENLDPVARAGLVKTVVGELLALIDVSTFRLHTVVVCVPGIVDTQGRMILSNPIPGWSGVNLAAWFGVGLKAGLVVENDVNMATLAEHQLGAGRFTDDLMLVHVGHRMNAGLVLGGQLHRGHNDSAGEIADVEESGWVALTESAAPMQQSLAPDDPGAVLRAAVQGDEDALETLQAFARRVAMTIAAVSAAIDPDLVVIGGGLSSAGETLVAPIRDAVAALIHQRPAPGMVASQLGADGVVLGGLVRALQIINERLYQAPDLPLPTITLHEGETTAATATQRSRARIEVPAPEPLRLGVVGVGARSAMAALVNEPEMGARLVAAADTHPLARTRAAEHLGPDVEVVTDHHQLVDLGVDAVIVMSPDDTHADITCDLLQAGVAVYVEKPLATTTKDADRILRTAYETGTRLYVGHNARHLAVVRLLREVIARGEIGEVKAIWCRHFVGNGGDYYFKDWHAEREHSTGLLLQKGAHDIDVMHWLADSFTRDVVGMGDLAVYGQVSDRTDHSAELMPDWFSMDHWPPLAQRGLNPVIDVEDLSMVLMRMESGVLASYQQCHFTPDYWRNYTVIGMQGRAENFGDGDGGVVRVWNSRTTYHPRGDREYPIRGDAFGHDEADALTIREFLRFVRKGGPTQTSPLGAREAVAVGAAATESLRGGSAPHRVDPVPHEIAEYFENHQSCTPYRR